MVRNVRSTGSGGHLLQEPVQRPRRNIEDRTVWRAGDDRLIAMAVEADWPWREETSFRVLSALRSNLAIQYTMSRYR